MMWPSCLSIVALLNSLAARDESGVVIENGSIVRRKGMSRFMFFWICVVGMSICEFFFVVLWESCIAC
jgi:hypothetical protein